MDRQPGLNQQRSTPSAGLKGGLGVLSGKVMVSQAIDALEEACMRWEASHAAPTTGEVLPPVGPWFVPHPNRDLAARITARLLFQMDRRVGYLALGECGLHAVLRIWVLETGFTKADAICGNPPEINPGLYGRVANRLAMSNLQVNNMVVDPAKIRKVVRCFVEQVEPDVLVVDDPDAAGQRFKKLLPELARWRVRMEFREAVRGMKVVLLMPA